MHSFSKPPPYSKNYSTVLVRSKLSADSVEHERRSVVSDSLWPHGLYSPWNSPGQNTGVGSLSLLQGIFPTQGSNAGLWHCKWILYQLSHQGTSRILEWVACPFASRSSPPRNQTGVTCIAGRFFTSWATREADSVGAVLNVILSWATWCDCFSFSTKCFVVAVFNVLTDSVSYTL